MSWIIHEYWEELNKQLPSDQSKLSSRMFTIANEVAAKVGQKWGLTIQVNFPAGMAAGSVPIGRENLSLLVETGRRKFQGVSEDEVKNHLELLDERVRLEPPGHGYEGYRAILSDRKGRIDCLPGGVHLWCTITPNVLEFLDWLFENAYGIRPD